MAKPPGVSTNVIEMVRLHQAKESFTDAVLAAALTSWGGWTWNETHVAALLAGKKKPTAEEVVYFKHYLLYYYVAYCTS